MIRTALCYLLALVIAVPLAVGGVVLGSVLLQQQAHKANMAARFAEHRAAMATLSIHRSKF